MTNAGKYAQTKAKKAGSAVSGALAGAFGPPPPPPVPGDMSAAAGFFDRPVTAADRLGVQYRRQTQGFDSSYQPPPGALSNAFTPAAPSPYMKGDSVFSGIADYAGVFPAPPPIDSSQQKKQPQMRGRLVDQETGQ